MRKIRRKLGAILLLALKAGDQELITETSELLLFISERATARPPEVYIPSTMEIGMWERLGLNVL